MSNAASEDASIYEVEKILDVRGVGANKRYLVHWAGYPVSEATWEAESNFSKPPVMPIISPTRSRVRKWSKSPPKRITSKSPKKKEAKSASAKDDVLKVTAKTPVKTPVKTKRTSSKSPSRSSKKTSSKSVVKLRSRSASRGGKVSERPSPKSVSRSRSQSRSRKTAAKKSPSQTTVKPVSKGASALKAIPSKISGFTESIFSSSTKSVEEPFVRQSRPELKQAPHRVAAEENVLRRRGVESSMPAPRRRYPLLEKTAGMKKTLQAHFSRFSLFYAVMFMLLVIAVTVYLSGHNIQKTLKNLQSEFSGYIAKIKK